MDDRANIQAQQVKRQPQRSGAADRTGVSPFAPEDHADTHDRYLRSVVFAFSAVGAAALFTFGLYSMLLHQSVLLGSALLGAALALASMPLLYRYTGSMALCSHLAAFVSCGIVATTCILRSGFPHSTLAFLALVPLFLVHLQGRKAATLWTSVALLLTLGFYLRTRFGWTTVGAVAGGEPLLDYLRVTFLQLAVYGMSVAYSLGRDRAERATKSAQRQLQLSSRLESVGQLAGGVAHDFNNILTVILNTTTCAMESLESSEGVSRGDLEMIEAAGKRAADLTRQLLLFSRRELTRRVAIDLGELITALVPLMRRTMPESIEIALRGVDEGGLTIRGDRSQMEQVFVNLAINARDAMPHGGQLTIELEHLALNKELQREGVVVPPGRYVQLRVGDTGQGIPKDVVERIFDPFFTTKGRGLGSGLGLATVYGIVKKAGGFIWVDSEVDKGTHFTLWFAACTESPAASSYASISNTGAPALGRGETILLVEDEPAVRSSTSRVLTRGGYNVRTAEDGQQAQDLFAKHREEIKLLVSDVIMPKMSGPQLAEALRNLEPELPILFISGYTDRALEPHQVGRSGFPLLRKPFSEDGLLRQVAKALETHRRREHAAALLS